jgi:alpha-L-arabinofuranosidase
MLFALSPLVASAEDTRIAFHVISGGGGTNSSGNIVLSGTLGQPVAGLATGGDYTLQAGFWGISLVVVVGPDESFESWMENLADAEKPPEGQRGTQDKPAGDGMANLLKYALGLMPMTPSADAAPKVAFDEGYLTIELGRSLNAAVTFELEGSMDLTSWVDVPFSEDVISANIGDNRERVLLLTGLSKNDHPRYFLRLVVKMP